VQVLPQHRYAASFTILGLQLGRLLQGDCSNRKRVFQPSCVVWADADLGCTEGVNYLVVQAWRYDDGGFVHRRQPAGRFVVIPSLIHD